MRFRFPSAFILSNRRKAIIWAAVAVVCGYGMYSVVAATQGSLATSSAGSIVISVIKPARANITGLSDMTITGWVAGDGDQFLSEDVCVYSTRPSGGYTIKAIGSGPGNGFVLSNGIGTLPYDVKWNAGGVGALSSSGSTLTANVSSSGFTNAANDSSTCNGATAGPTARLMVKVMETSLEAASAGTYMGTLTLMVTPN